MRGFSTRDVDAALMDALGPGRGGLQIDGGSDLRRQQGTAVRGGAEPPLAESSLTACLLDATCCLHHAKVAAEPELAP